MEESKDWKKDDEWSDDVDDDSDDSEDMDDGNHKKKDKILNPKGHSIGKSRKM